LKYTGQFTRVNKDGAVSIPKHVLSKVGISEKTTVEFIATNNSISIKKKQLACLITGNTSESVKEVLPGIPLSEEGMQILLKQLKSFNLLF